MGTEYTLCKDILQVIDLDLIEVIYSNKNTLVQSEYQIYKLQGKSQ